MDICRCDYLKKIDIVYMNVYYKQTLKIHLDTFCLKNYIYICML